jgi:hypothetical protein
LGDILEQLGQVCFGFVNVDLSHGSPFKLNLV